MSKSNIEWTGSVWNFIIGCLKKSAGCENCYAIKEAWVHSFHPNEKISGKFNGTVKKTAGGKLNWTGKINFHEPALLVPLQTKKPDLWFVNSLSDLFYEEVTIEIIAEGFAVMLLAHWHTFQVLTKRPERMLAVLNNEMFYAHLWGAVQRISGKECTYEEVFSKMPLKNVWLGTSVEDQNQADLRIPYLLQTPAAIRFLSCEPLLGPVEFSNVTHRCDVIKQLGKKSLNGIDWVIAGGESGHKARPMHPDWVRSIRDQCEATSVPFFFKQWGEYLPYEETAQPPFWRDCAGRSEYDAHGMNFTDPDTSEAGKWFGKRWMDSMDAIILCEENGNDQAMFLKVGKHAAGSLLDGKEHKTYPKSFTHAETI